MVCGVVDGCARETLEGWDWLGEGFGGVWGRGRGSGYGSRL